MVIFSHCFFLHKTLHKQYKDKHYEKKLEPLQVFRNKIHCLDRAKVNASESDIEDAPTVGLEEMLDDLQIEDQEMNSDED